MQHLHAPRAVTLGPHQPQRGGPWGRDRSQQQCRENNSSATHQQGAQGQAGLWAAAPGCGYKAHQRCTCACHAGVLHVPYAASGTPSRPRCHVTCETVGVTVGCTASPPRVAGDMGVPGDTTHQVLGCWWLWWRAEGAPWCPGRGRGELWGKAVGRGSRLAGKEPGRKRPGDIGQQPGKWLSHGRCPKDTQMCLGTWFGARLGSARLTAGLDDLPALFQPLRFYHFCLSSPPVPGSQPT